MDRSIFQERSMSFPGSLDFDPAVTLELDQLERDC
jgi:hypothetical protein